jgi:hypothetical protein
VLEKKRNPYVFLFKDKDTSFSNSDSRAVMVFCGSCCDKLMGSRKGTLTSQCMHVTASRGKINDSFDSRLCLLQACYTQIFISVPTSFLW